MALTIWTFVGKMMSLLFNTQSKFIMAFLPRSNHQPSSNFMAAVTVHSDFKAQEEICPCFHLFLLHLP